MVITKTDTQIKKKREPPSEVTNRVAATKVPVNQTGGMASPVGYNESSKKRDL